MSQTKRTRQLAAIASLLCVAALIVVLTVLLWRHFWSLGIALIGLVITTLGGWWAVTRDMPRRAVGIAVAVLGVGVIVAAFVNAFSDAEQVILRLLVVVVLIAATGALARVALLPDADTPSVVTGTRQVPRHPVLICNPWSGGGKVDKFGLVELAEQKGVEVVMLDHGLDLEQLARDAIARGADCLGMAGGDGSQALVASIAIEHDLPFVCVSAGTRNHFALDLGLNRDDPRLSMAAFTDAVERRVDYARVNGRLFVNNVSLGIYATVVQQDEYRDAKAATFSSMLPQLLGPDAEPFDLQFDEPDGTLIDGAFLIMVSNNPYVTGTSLDQFERRQLDTGQLGVLAVDAPGAPEAARLLAASAAGLRQHSNYWHEFAVDAFEVRSRSGKAFAGVDGEALEMDTPLRFELFPGGLRLLVPSDNLDVAQRRQARGVRVADLADIARGHH